MKKLYFYANLKMNLSKQYLKDYLQHVNDFSKKFTCEIGISFPYIYLPLAHSKLKKSKVKKGAQNVFYEHAGAYTGEISAEMLKDYDTDFSLVGHSERRNLFNETDELINKKIKILLINNINPILCIGETHEQKEKSFTNKVVKNQLISAYCNVNLREVKNLIIAYEPVWAIGTGLVPSLSEIESTIAFIKQVLNEEFNVNNAKVLYGGSVNQSNAKEILSINCVDGALIGGASLNYEKFINILKTL